MNIEILNKSQIDKKEFIIELSKKIPKTKLSNLINLSKYYEKNEENIKTMSKCELIKKSLMF